MFCLSRSRCQVKSHYNVVVTCFTPLNPAANMKWWFKARIDGVGRKIQTHSFSPQEQTVNTITYVLYPFYTQFAQCTQQCQSKSLHITCAVNTFYGTEFEIWAGFGPVGSTEFGANCEQLLRAVLKCRIKVRKSSLKFDYLYPCNTFTVKCPFLSTRGDGGQNWLKFGPRSCWMPH